MPLIIHEDGGMTLDEDFETAPLYSPVCSFCAHLDLDAVRRCSAFPDVIPLPIWTGKNDHPFPTPATAVLSSRSGRRSRQKTAVRSRKWAKPESLSLHRQINQVPIGEARDSELHVPASPVRAHSVRQGH